jgi:hypothetical protein
MPESPAPPNEPAPPTATPLAPEDPVTQEDFRGYKRFLNSEQAHFRKKLESMESVMSALADYLEREAKLRRGDVNVG